MRPVRKDGERSPLYNMEQYESELVARIKELELRASKYETLCGEILATLKVNLLRETLTTQDDFQFNKLLESWYARMILTD